MKRPPLAMQLDGHLAVGHSAATVAVFSAASISTLRGRLARLTRYPRSRRWWRTSDVIRAGEPTCSLRRRLATLRATRGASRGSPRTGRSRPVRFGVIRPPFSTWATKPHCKQQIKPALQLPFSAMPRSTNPQRGAEAATASLGLLVQESDSRRW